MCLHHGAWKIPLGPCEQAWQSVIILYIPGETGGGDYRYRATAALSLVMSSTRSTISLLRMMNVVGMPVTL